MVTAEVPPPSKRTIGPDSKIRLTVRDLITLVGIITGGTVAWEKLPSVDEVRNITRESVQQAVEAAAKRDHSLERKIGDVDDRTEKLDSELRKLNSRMDYMIILLAGSAADEMRRSPAARQTAGQVRRNLAQGNEPLDGLPWAGED